MERLHLLQLDVRGDVDQHRTRAARGCDVERLLKDAGQVRRILDQIRMLRKGLARAGDVSLLEHIAAQQPGVHLAGDRDQGDGIHICRRNAGDQVGCAGAGGRDADAGLAARAGIAAGHMRGILFLPHQDMFDVRFCNIIIKWADRCARITEQMGNAFVLQAFHHDFRSANHRATPSPLNRIQRRSVSGGGDRVSCRFYYLTYYSIVPFFRQEKGRRILTGKCNWAWEIFQEVPRAHMRRKRGPPAQSPHTLLGQENARLLPSPALDCLGSPCFFRKPPLPAHSVSSTPDLENLKRLGSFYAAFIWLPPILQTEPIQNFTGILHGCGGSRGVSGI